MLYKKESHYLATVTAMTGIYVFFMHYVFNVAWADSSRWLQIINAGQHAIPALRRLHDHAVAIYTNYWGAFYTGFWMMSPIHWLFGVLGVPFLDVKRRTALVDNISMKRLVLMVAIFSSMSIMLYEIPMLDAMGIYSQTSSSFLILCVTWWLVALAMYYQGQLSRVLWVKVVTKYTARRG